MTKYLRFFLFCFVLSASFLFLNSCSTHTDQTSQNFLEKRFDEVLAAKTPYAVSKINTPVLTTYDWDSIFGGPLGENLAYDSFGEIDQLVFVAPPYTVFRLHRQVRKKTRNGLETIYYKVSFFDSHSDEALWVDGRFLDLQDVLPTFGKKNISTEQIIQNLRSFNDLPYTWHGSSDTGVPELLQYYPPLKPLSPRLKNDWILKGFDSIGLLFKASQGQAPVEWSRISTFGEGISVDFSNITEKSSGFREISIKKAEKLRENLKPLDLIIFEDRLIIVLDKVEVIESRYRSAFDGKVTISSLFETLVGLFEKAEFVTDPSSELPNPNMKRFFVRRFTSER